MRLVHGWLCLTLATILLLLTPDGTHAAKNRRRRPRKDQPAAEEDARGGVRLPGDLRPVHYVVRLHPYLRGNLTVNGRLDVELETLKSTRRIVFHLADITVVKDSVRVAPINKRARLPIRRHQYDSHKEQYILHLRRRLRPGNVYVLSLSFLGRLSNTTTKGFYVSSYRDEQGVERRVAATQFWPTEARRAFPCWDEPEMKATFNVFLGRHTNNTALANMQLVRTTKMRGRPGWVWDQFATSLNMSTYLVAFAITAFPHRTLDAEAKTRIEVWSRPGTLDQTTQGLEVANFSLHFFESYYNLSYPLRKVDMVALPRTSYSGIENWGLITYRESSFLSEPEHSSGRHLNSVSQLVAHEIAHQWFGNLVTFKWWPDLWLNEGFATYMANVAVDKLAPSWGVLDHFVVEKQMDVMAMDAMRSSHPIRAPVPDPAFIHEVFDAIPYLKGASVIRMMSHFLTDTTFQKGINRYLKAMKYVNADQDDLWDFLTKAALEDKSLPPGVTVKAIMDTWTLQEGFPVITVRIDHKGNARLRQKRFLVGGEGAWREEDAGLKWWVPVTFTSQKRAYFGHTRAQTWLSSHADHVTVTGVPPPQFWHLFNIQVTGFYRVHYSDYNWNLLAFQLQEDHQVIHVTNRAQILDDALNVARAGMLSYSVALNTTVYLGEERGYVPWRAMLQNMEFLHTMFLHTPSYGALKDYLLSLLEPLYNTLGLEDDPEDDLGTQLLRVEVVRWTCRLQHHHCVNASVNLVRRWMDDPNNSIGVGNNIAEPMLCSAVLRGDAEVWEFIWQRFLSTKAGGLQDALEVALGCTSNVWLLARYLEEAVRGPERVMISRAFKSVSSSGVGSLLAWHYITSNWHLLQNHPDLPALIKASTQHLNTQAGLMQLKHLLETRLNTKGREEAETKRNKREKREVEGNEEEGAEEGRGPRRRKRKKKKKKKKRVEEETEPMMKPEEEEEEPRKRKKVEEQEEKQEEPENRRTEEEEPNTSRTEGESENRRTEKEPTDRITEEEEPVTRRTEEEPTDRRTEEEPTNRITEEEEPTDRRTEEEEQESRREEAEEPVTRRTEEEPTDRRTEEEEQENRREEAEEPSNRRTGEKEPKKKKQEKGPKNKKNKEDEEPKQKEDSITKALKQALERVTNNVAWRTRSMAHIVAWINERGFSHSL